MTIPTAYTETTLATFMHGQIGDFPTVFTWAAPAGNAGVYQEAVNDALMEYGVSDIALATDIKKLRALARVAVWKKVLTQLPTYYKFAADGSSFERQQMFDMARQALATAETEAGAYLSGYEIGVGTVTWANDPYRYPPTEDAE